MHGDNITIIAAWLVEGATLGRLLQDEGKLEHALNLEAAMYEVRLIVARKIGAGVLSELMDSFSDDLWERSQSGFAAGSREIH